MISISLGMAAASWVKTYGEATRSESANSVIQTADGGFAIVGSAGDSFGHSDACLVKADSAGKMQWSQTYGGADSESGASVFQTSDGGYAVAGTINTDYNGSYVWLFKTDASGTMQWKQIFNGSEVFREVNGHWVVQTKDGGYAVACDLYWDSWSESGFSLIKTDSSGNLLWNQTYGQRATSSRCAFVETSDGGFALASSMARENVRHGSDFWLIKTDSSGKMQWNQTYSDGLGDDAYSIVQTSDGGYALAGDRGGTGSLVDERHQDFMLVKTDSNGKEQWIKSYGGIDYEIPYSVVQTKDGGYALAGYSMVWDRSKLANQSDYTTNWVVKTDSLGNMQWSKTYGNPDTREIAYSIIQTTDSGYAIAGVISVRSQSGEDPDDFWLVKTDENGNVSSGQTTPLQLLVPRLLSDRQLLMKLQALHHLFQSSRQGPL
jgi:hypothetical protein